MDDKKRSFVDSIIAKKGHLIHKLKAKDTTGRWAYYFVLVEAPREAAFLKSIEGDGTIDLEDFGKVVASCLWRRALAGSKRLPQGKIRLRGLASR